MYVYIWAKGQKTAIHRSTSFRTLLLCFAYRYGAGIFALDKKPIATAGSLSHAIPYAAGTKHTYTYVHMYVHLHMSIYVYILLYVN